MENINGFGNEYPIPYQLSMDIDWFFCFNGIFFHGASNGFLLPKKAKTKDNEEFFVNQHDNAQIQIDLALLMSDDKSSRFEIEVRPNPHNLNYNSFMEFAEMGFVSLDTIEVHNKKYSLQVIARPKEYKDLKIKRHIVDKIKPLDVNVAGFQISDINGTPLNLE